MIFFNRKIVLFGCGGHGRSVSSVLFDLNSNADLLFVDKNAGEEEKLYGCDIYREYSLGDEQVFFAIGDNALRKRKFEEIGEKNLISVISRTAQQGYQSIVKNGCFVGNFCHLGPESNIGKNTILNNAAVIEHEVKIGAHCHIGPNAVISGRCNIGDSVFIGVGVTVKDYISICSHVVIGAGSTVVSDIVESGIYTGIPARRVK